MLDTNALIHLLRGDERMVTRAQQCEAGALSVSAIAFAEVALGTVAGRPPAAAVLERVPNRIPVVPFDIPEARVYATLPFKRHRFDRLIAAHALALDLTLITANPRDFADIPGLKIEDWTQ